MQGRRFVTAVAVCSIVCVLGAPASPALAAPTPLPSDGVLIVPGHGWGHGRGMGQWGARGLAEQGKTYRQILSAYYSGATLTSRPAGEDIRVLVEKSPDVLVTSATAYTARLSGKVVATSSSASPFMRTRWDGSAYVLERSAKHTGPWSKVTSSTAYPVYVPGTSKLELVLGSGKTVLYRGEIHTRYNSTDGMRAINVLPIQSYLGGVVPSEMPSSWPAEALRAQSIAARTYSIYKKDSARSKGTVFDICATTSCQVYTGYAYRSSPSGSATVVERSSTNNAIAATAGEVLTYGGKPILAEFSSSTGGHSAPGSVPYQKAVPDPGDAISPHHDWQASISVSEVQSKWPQVGRLTGIEVTDRDGFGEWGGRVRKMTISGTSGSVTISGSAWRSAFAWPGRSGGVRGTWFTVLTYAGDLAAQPGTLVVPVGSTRNAVVKVRNTGTATWPVGGPVRLTTDGASPLANDDWISPTVAAPVTGNLTSPARNDVPPGHIASFEIPIYGERSGVFSETFRAEAAGISPMSTSANLRVEVIDSWFDEGPNLLTGGSFDDGTAPWAGSGLVGGDGRSIDSPRHGPRTFRMRGAGGTKQVSQKISFSGGLRRTFTLGGWSRSVGSSASGGPIEIAARVLYADGGGGTVTLPFQRASHGWTYDERAFRTSSTRPLSSITVMARTSGQTGYAYFDAIRLHESDIFNASFEDRMIGWHGSGLAGGDGSTTSTARDGARSLTLSGADGTKRVSQAFKLPARRSERFTVSFWSKSSARPEDAGEASVAIGLRAADGDTDTTRVDIPATDHGWTYREVTVRATATLTSARLTVTLAGPQGRVWVDGLRMTRTFTADQSMESGADWGGYGLSGTEGIVDQAGAAAEGAQGALLAGSGKQGVFQRIALTSGGRSTYRFQGWSRTATAERGFAGFVVVFRNTDGSATGVRIAVPTGRNAWTFTEALVYAPKAFHRADVYAQLNDSSGSAWFDAIRLAKV